MTNEQRQKAISVIEKDATAQYSYFKDGATCAIGGLLLAVGTSQEDLEKASTSYIYAFPDFLEILKQHYGLDRWQCSELQTINDDFSDLEARRRQLIAKVNEFCPQPTE